METVKESFGKRTDKNKDDPTKPFPNSDKPSAAIINRSGSKKIKSHGKGGNKVVGPNWDVESKDVDGDTTSNAGVFK
jgi:hypothetical protein